MASRKRIKRADFVAGVGWAMARLIDFSDQPTLALDLMREADITTAEIRALDEADRKPIQKAFGFRETEES